MNQPVSQGDNTLGVVELRIPSKAEWVAVARLAIAAVANRLTFSIEDIEDVKLAVAEACTNCIQHAEGSTQIEITCETHVEGLTVRVRDFGRGTRPEEIQSRRVDAPRVGGLGVFLIRSLMDTVEYDVHPEHGTSLVMTKKVTS
ncbi:MAG: ATP-binding protein [Candidatus Eremiobacteraeota bacterium]|nr:ATP-binding protein [Candidatus Eremiobacteraeota bacterium]MDQ6822905.1 ATP-binding protein [Candidatus Eremiobacteraeota bacterium]